MKDKQRNQKVFIIALSEIVLIWNFIWSETRTRWNAISISISISVTNLRPPFFLIANIGSKAVTNFPVFLSFFFMSVSLLQLNSQNKNSYLLKNFPVFNQKIKIPQKFETFYFQNPAKIYDREESEEEETITNRFHEQIDEDTEFEEFDESEEEDNTINKFPRNFQHIVSNKQSVVNLFKLFEKLEEIETETQEELDVFINQLLYQYFDFLKKEEEDENILHKSLQVFLQLQYRSFFNFFQSCFLDGKLNRDDFFYQLQQIRDRIPSKIQGCEESTAAVEAVEAAEAVEAEKLNKSDAESDSEWDESEYNSSEEDSEDESEYDDPEDVLLETILSSESAKNSITSSESEEDESYDPITAERPDNSNRMVNMFRFLLNLKKTNKSDADNRNRKMNVFEFLQKLKNKSDDASESEEELAPSLTWMWDCLKNRRKKKKEINFFYNKSLFQIVHQQFKIKLESEKGKYIEEEKENDEHLQRVGNSFKQFRLSDFEGTMDLLSNFSKLPRTQNFEDFYDELIEFKERERELKEKNGVQNNAEDEDEDDDEYIFENIDEILNEIDLNLSRPPKPKRVPLPQLLPVRQMSGYMLPDLKSWSYIQFLDDGWHSQNLEELYLTPSPSKFLTFKKTFSKDKEEQYSEIRENFNNFSWSFVFFISCGWIFVNLFKTLYKKHGKEIIEYGIDLLNKAGIFNYEQGLWIKQELGITPKSQSYFNRGIRHQDKKCKNIIGLDSQYILLQVREIVWFLKTKQLIKNWSDPWIKIILFANDQTMYSPLVYLKPKGFLFSGPPGTGKTLLVQAIAGDSGVPVITQSGGLFNLLIRGKGVRTLNKLFKRAREISPCIIFIDEIDGIGARRPDKPIGIDIRGHYDPVGFLENNENEIPPSDSLKSFKLSRKPGFWDDHDLYWKEPEFTQTFQPDQIPIDVLQEIESSRLARNEQVNLLTKLLIELDGVQLLENILVIGATNRLSILDPALMRPGRFQRIFKFNLPDSDARQKLFKLYASRTSIGLENISWDYFSKRTYGFSSADIASVVFASELIAIEQSIPHTLDTLERGIDLITSFPSDPVMFRLKKVFLNLSYSLEQFLYQGKMESTSSGEIWTLLRNSYYNIGKMLIFFCLELMPLASIPLWERPLNFRFLFFQKNFNEFLFEEFDEKRFSRVEIEKRLLSFFGGKAGESLYIFLPLQKFQTKSSGKTFFHFSNSVEQSNYGIENEIQHAQNLLKLMIEKWYLYLEKIATEKFHPILENVNLSEYGEFGKGKEIFISQAIVEEMMIDLDMRNRLSKNEQKHSYKTWWMKKVTTRCNFSGTESANDAEYLLWSRIYLADPENYSPNIEWVPPDEYFHTLLRTPPPAYSMPWTHFLENGRSIIANLLFLKSFNTVFKTLRQFSEFFDFLSDSLFRYECLRDPEFQCKIEKFFNSIR